jgi:hypothetical protein
MSAPNNLNQQNATNPPTHAAMPKGCVPALSKEDLRAYNTLSPEQRAVADTYAQNQLTRQLANGESYTPQGREAFLANARIGVSPNAQPILQVGLLEASYRFDAAPAVPNKPKSARDVCR